MIVLGSKAIGLAIARAATGARILTFDDRADGRSELAAFRELGAEVIDPKAPPLDDPLVVVAGWYWRLPPSSPERRVLGFHNSLLPAYRGGSPLVWAMIRGEPEVGVSLFELAERMDAGAVWGQARETVGPDDTITDVLARLELASVGLFRELMAGRLTPHEQDGEATYCAQRSAEDGLVNWTWPAQRVHDFVRAQTRPYPGAFDIRGHERFPIWRTRIREGTVIGSPGQMYRGAVICGDDRAVEILDPVGFGVL